PAEARAVLAPKVDGTLVLAELLAADDLDFLVLCSSLTAFLGGIGQAAYAAANAFLGAFAEASAAAGRRVVAIDWDAWRGVGMAARPGESAAAPRREAAVGAPSAHPLLGGRNGAVADGDGEGGAVFLSRLR